VFTGLFILLCIFEKYSSTHVEKLPKFIAKKRKKKVWGMVFRKILKNFSHDELGE